MTDFHLIKIKMALYCHDSWGFGTEHYNATLLKGAISSNKISGLVLKFAK